MISGANGNVTHSPDCSCSSTGSGKPASRHSVNINSMPRPQASISPARKNALAMPGLNGCEECFPFSLATVHNGGSWPGFQIISLSAYTLIWMVAPDA